jgi:uroporphyrinogen-III synthase
MKALAGRRIALPEGRERARLAELFAQEGADVLSCPLVAIVDAPDPAPVDRFLRGLAAGAFDDLVLLTGEGLRRLMARAEKIGRTRAVRAALERVRKVTRGPKPAQALRELGLFPDLPASTPTTEGLREVLALTSLRGRRVGVQLCAEDSDTPLVSFLSRAGAAVQAVAPYAYAPGTDAGQLEALIRQLADGSVDAIAFTNAAQVNILFDGAEELGLAAELRGALDAMLVAAVGPATAEPLRRRGFEPLVTPGNPFGMERLVATVAAALGSAPAVRPANDSRRLLGRRIALPEQRELDRLAEMLEAEGASTVRCPLMAIFDAPDPAPIARWLRALALGRFDDVIFFTGEGVRRLIDLSTRLGIRDEVLRALGGVRKITRGPKPARALHEVGLRTDLPSSTPTSQGVIEALAGETLTGRRVALQLFGEDPNRALVDFLEGKGAQVHPVAPYRYAPATHDEKVASLIDGLAGGGIDAIAFTTAFQVDRLLQVARRRGLEEALREGLARMHVAAVGPVVFEAMRRAGIRVDGVPAKQFFMRRLTQEMAARLGPKSK